MFAIVGLGNPGARYAETRHNVGWMCLDRLAARRKAGKFKAKGGLFRAALYESASFRSGGGEVLLVKPLTYMNESGRAVAALKCDAGESLVIVHDDLDLPFGTVRVKFGGGDGGQKGVRSVIEHLGTGDFVRLRLGIAGAEKPADAAEFVLSPFDAEEEKALDGFLTRACDASETIAREGAQKAMNKFNAATVQVGASPRKI
jgi:peptidyl-tRNA hydrolase, PTH1 family